MPKQEPRARKRVRGELVGRARELMEKYPSIRPKELAGEMGISARRSYNLMYAIRQGKKTKPKAKPSQPKNQLERDIESIRFIGVDRVKRILELLEE